MADRDKSFFGPVLADVDDQPAFSFDDLQRIRGRRLEVEVGRAHCSAFPETRRFATIYPGCGAPRLPQRATEEQCPPSSDRLA